MAADLVEVNVGHMRPTENEELLNLLREFIGVFAENSTMLPACEGNPMHLRLKDPRCAVYVAPARHYSSGQREMIRAKMEKLRGNVVVRESSSN